MEMEAKKKVTAGAWSKMIDEVVKAEEILKNSPYPSNAADHAAKANAHKRAAEALKIARDTLRAAMETAEWGQSGSAFVTIRRDWWLNNGEHVNVYINRRVRATMNHGRVTVFTYAQAETQFREVKEAARATNRTNERAKEEIVREMVRSGAGPVCQDIGDWQFVDGQKGGSFRHKHDGRTVSARGVMNAYADNQTDYDFLLPEEIDAERRYYGARY